MVYPIGCAHRLHNKMDFVLIQPKDSQTFAIFDKMDHKDMNELINLSTKADDIKAIQCCAQAGHKLIMHSMSKAGNHSLHVYNKRDSMRYDIDYEPIGGDLGLTDGFIVNDEVSKLFFAEKKNGEAMKLTIVDFWM